MIAMQVADENVIDPMEFNMKAIHLDERAFTAVH
jgi:hypothetical protein